MNLYISASNRKKNSYELLKDIMEEEYEKIVEELKRMIRE